MNLIHGLTDEGDDVADVPLEDLLEEWPELHGARSRLAGCFGHSELLRTRPGCFTVGCLVEVLGRWACRGVAVGAAKAPAQPPPELEATLPPRQRREYTETMQTMFAEYEPRMEALVRRAPALAVVRPIYAAIAHGARPQLPPVADSLLRGPLHAHMRCALPGCGRSTDAETGKALKLCSGGCGGLARYCSAAHARQHWPQHKHFCVRA